jgi:hypothetical protein
MPPTRKEGLGLESCGSWVSGYRPQMQSSAVLIRVGPNQHGEQAAWRLEKLATRHPALMGEHVHSLGWNFLRSCRS